MPYHKPKNKYLPFFSSFQALLHFFPTSQISWCIFQNHTQYLQNLVISLFSLCICRDIERDFGMCTKKFGLWGKMVVVIKVIRNISLLVQNRGKKGKKRGKRKEKAEK
jgi:hypothetical protein